VRYTIGNSFEIDLTFLKGDFTLGFLLTETTVVHYKNQKKRKLNNYSFYLAGKGGKLPLPRVKRTYRTSKETTPRHAQGRGSFPTIDQKQKLTAPPEQHPKEELA
jgi:hypothetical protein